jgi:DNA-binding NarL/FixJ family response regulator
MALVSRAAMSQQTEQRVDAAIDAPQSFGVETALSTTKYLPRVIRARSQGFLAAMLYALHQSLRLVLLGEKVFPTDLARLLTSDRIMARNDAAQMGHVNGLSDREMQILGYLLNGAQNKQIARDLQISDGTVKVHLKAILKKIGVQNRTQAAIWAVSQGIGPLHGDGPDPEGHCNTPTATLAK